MRNMEPYRLYRIVHIHRICIADVAWFLTHIREDPSDILSDVYVYFLADDMFTTNSEFAVNHRHIYAHLFYDGESVLIIGHVGFNYRSSLQMSRRHPEQNIDQPMMYNTATLVRIHRLQLHRRYFILRVDRLTMERTECILLTLRQCPVSHIYIHANPA